MNCKKALQLFTPFNHLCSVKTLKIVHSMEISKNLSLKIRIGMVVMIAIFFVRAYADGAIL